MCCTSFIYVALGQLCLLRHPSTSALMQHTNVSSQYWSRKWPTGSTTPARKVGAAPCDRPSAGCAVAVAGIAGATCQNAAIGNRSSNRFAAGVVDLRSYQAW